MNVTNAAVIEKLQEYTQKSPSPLGMVTGIFVVLLLYILQNMRRMNGKSKLTVCWPVIIDEKIVFTMLSWIFILILSPLILIVFVMCYIYRSVIQSIIACDVQYRGMMSGPDALWSIADQKSSAIIHILAIIKIKNRQTFKKNLEDTLSRLQNSQTCYDKIFYWRSAWMGYFYWRQPTLKKYSDYIGEIKCGQRSYVTRDDVHEEIENCCNLCMPCNNCGLWQILQFDAPLNEGKDLYPVLIRVHHSLGDGVALLKLLSVIFTDSKWDIAKDLKKFAPSVVHELTMKEKLAKLWIVPETLFKQGLHPCDANALHPSELSGEKIVESYAESEMDGLMEKIKKFKMKMPKVRFSDFLASAVAASLQQTLSVVPEKITAVTLARVSHSTEALGNNFSVALLSLPMSKGPFLRLTEVKNATERLGRSVDFQVNYFIMTTVASLLPEPIIKPLVYSDKATLVLSNMPGPEVGNIQLCGENALKELVFFVPNRGTTGIGISFFSYGGKLDLGLIADRAAVDSRKKAKTILKGIVEEIHHIDDVMSIKETEFLRKNV